MYFFPAHTAETAQIPFTDYAAARFCSRLCRKLHAQGRRVHHTVLYTSFPRAPPKKGFVQILSKILWQEKQIYLYYSTYPLLFAKFSPKFQRFVFTNTENCAIMLLTL
jgi:hypothetical protein